MSSILRNALVTILFAFAVAPTQTLGGGILHTFSPAIKDQAFAVARPAILVSKTYMTASESKVEYDIEQIFFNDNDLPIEAVYLYPLDTGSTQSSLRIQVDGVLQPVNIIPSDRFFPILKSWVEVNKDPSLLELAGRNVLLIGSLHLKPRQEIRFHLQFSIPVQIENEELDLSLPLAGERYALGPVGLLEITVRSKMDRPIGTVFSTTHNITTLREASHRCTVTVKLRNARVRIDFRLLFTYSRNNPDFKIFTHRTLNEKGFFAAFIEPSLTEREIDNRHNNFVFLMDHSGSIGSENVDVAKRAMIFGLERLHGGDQFNVFALGSHVEKFTEKLIPATSDNIANAVRFVNAAESEGGTDLYNVIMSALDQFKSGKRRGVILLATDGRATIGLTEPEIMIQEVKKNNPVKCKICILALGKNADIALLDRIAIVSNGVLSHFTGKADLYPFMNNFFEKILPQGISDLTLSFPNITVEDLLPERIPDPGPEGAIVFGRYTNEETTLSAVRLSLKFKGRPRIITRNYSFPRQNEINSYVPRLWAMRRIASLWEKEILTGRVTKGNEELRKIAEEYGFKEPLPASTGTPLLAPETVNNSSELLWRFKTSNVAMDVESDLIKTINEKTFRLEKDAWIDTQYRISMPTQIVSFASDAYFSILKDEPNLGPYFALGSQLIVEYNHKAIKIIP